MILDVDVGNTRTKWLIHRQGEFDGAAVKALATSDLAINLDWDQYPVSRVRVSSVVSSGISAIVQWCEKRGITPEIAVVEDKVAGVTCGYRQPETLGIDRWLAVLAAHEIAKQDCLVVSAGTAVTLDVLCRTGQHLGGFILPGLLAMSESLDRKTSGVGRHSVPAPGLEPGAATPEAVGNGALLALVAAIEKAARLHQICNIVVTGGDGPLLADHLEGSDVAVLRSPHLVLRGLSVALP